MHCKKCGLRLAKETMSCPACSQVHQAVIQYRSEQPVYHPSHLNDRNRNKAIASLGLGLSGLLTWLIPLGGFGTSIIGFVMGIKGLNSSFKSGAIAGIVLNTLFFALSFVWFMMVLDMVLSVVLKNILDS
ncbi:MAG: hypothetical protein BGN88_13060 [Clostridiales bacterium 43-6]|nr:MAG: hypothetical protein BGN88_13060 [Clostridiales bacterium 43-6]